MSSFRLGLVGAGKIVRDQHLAAIQATPGLELVAVADPHAGLEGVPGHASLEAMLAAEPELDAVAICTPAHLRHALARQALEAGKAVLLEKPPGATLAEVEDLKALAEQRDLVLFAAWHSRFAPAIEPAREWLRERRISAIEITWHEDVRVWHPGQAWLWEAGGMGVFDPGINALSIVTRLVDQSFFLKQARLEVPENCQTPIAAQLQLRDGGGVPLEADFDFRHEDPPCWNMTLTTDQGRLELSGGGCRMSVDGDVVLDETEREYPGLYAHFQALLATGRRDVDVVPLRHVADAMMLGHRQATTAFHDASGA
ncbi:Gfo/Idh/MocA family oxidoreductase [Halomonas sabkhae]|uniref:Dehydrogenase n=1 Tax=Halomonas halmophila TaxID=252 RepID=A0A4Y4F7V4_9GAMM|nr:MULTISPECIES: Gfo/Idh/MocA family oxidoreductase [Halomonas]MDN3526280.1 Gfo/Idh/MocA family oxidoreductase [Halomonas sabkhae]GED23198.1 dehydrogenase [Halomonas halmophila]